MIAARIEGTGTYGAGIARFLGAHGVLVHEVNRPDRSTRRLLGKSDVDRRRRRQRRRRRRHRHRPAGVRGGGRRRGDRRFTAAGISNPELSILDDDLLDGLADSDRANLRMAVLRRLLEDKIRTIRRQNVVQGRLFSDLLDEAINRNTNRALTTAEIIAELVDLAKRMREAGTSRSRCAQPCGPRFAAFLRNTTTRRTRKSEPSSSSSNKPR